MTTNHGYMDGSYQMNIFPLKTICPIEFIPKGSPFHTIATRGGATEGFLNHIRNILMLKVRNFHGTVFVPLNYYNEGEDIKNYISNDMITSELIFCSKIFTIDSLITFNKITISIDNDDVFVHICGKEHILLEVVETDKFSILYIHSKK